MAAFDHVVSRLRAVQRVLGALAGSESFGLHVARHASTMRQMLGSSELARCLKGDDEKMVALLEAIQVAGFPADVEADLYGTVHETAMSGKRSGTGFQDYTLGFTYIGPQRWEYFMNPKISKSAKLFSLLAFFQSIGLNRPSEPTFRMLAGIYIICTMSDEAIDSQCAADRKATLDYIKGSWRVQAKGVDASVFIKSLLPQPSDFIVQYPSLSDDLQADPPDGQFHVDLHVPRLKMIIASIRCRGEDKSDLNKSQVPPIDQPFMGHANRCRDMLRDELRLALQDIPRPGDIDLHFNPRHRSFSRRPMLKDSGSTPGRGPLAIEDRPFEAVRPEDKHRDHPSEEQIETKKKKKKKKKRMADPDRRALAAAPPEPPTDAVVPVERPKKKKKKKTKVDPSKLASAMYKALFSRDESRKSGKPEKSMEATAATSARPPLKRPAAAPSAAQPKSKAKKIPPPLGCSKCRYLKNGCGTCRLKREEALKGK